MKTFLTSIIIGTSLIFSVNAFSQDSFQYSSQATLCGEVYDYTVVYQPVSQNYKLTVTKSGSEDTKTTTVKHLFNIVTVKEAFKKAVGDSCMNVENFTNIFLEMNSALNINLVKAPDAGYLTVKNCQAHDIEITSQSNFYIKYTQALNIQKKEIKKALWYAAEKERAERYDDQTYYRSILDSLQRDSSEIEILTQENLLRMELADSAKHQSNRQFTKLKDDRVGLMSEYDSHRAELLQYETKKVRFQIDSVNPDKDQKTLAQDQKALRKLGWELKGDRAILELKSLELTERRSTLDSIRSSIIRELNTVRKVEQSLVNRKHGIKQTRDEILALNDENDELIAQIPNLFAKLKRDTSRIDSIQRFSELEEDSVFNALEKNWQDNITELSDREHELAKKLDPTYNIINLDSLRLGTVDPSDYRKYVRFLGPSINAHFNYDIEILKPSQIKFENGLIEKILIKAKLSRGGYPVGTFIFENRSPIPFSTNNEIKALQQTKTKKDKLPRILDHSGKYYINLGDLLHYYEPKLHNNSFDISPKDMVLNLTEGNSEHTLQKDDTKDLIQATVFTDFVGFDTDNPNGLIQTEISRQTNIWSRRYSGEKEMTYVGFFTYINPSVVLSKIEDTNRRLLVSNRRDISTGSLLLAPHTSTMSLRNFEYLSAGFDLNLISWTIPDAKLRVKLGTDIHWGRIAMADSTYSFENNEVSVTGVREYDVNSISFTPAELTLRFFPDQRFGLYLKQRITRYHSFSNDFTQVSSSPEYVNSNSLGGSEQRYWFYTSEIYGYLDFVSFAKVFFRYRFNHQVGNLRSNFHQAQLGFSVDILGSYASKKK